MKDIYYNFNKILSYQEALIYIVIGERGCGKTYSAKRLVVNNFLKHNKQFVYLRRYKSELKEALKSGNFFSPVQDLFKEHKLSNDNKHFYCDDKVMGYSIPLSTANIIKGSEYKDVNLVIFDEFLIENAVYHYLPNEVRQFLDLCETVARLRDVRFIMIANPISVANPYFDYLNISLPYNSTIKQFYNGLIVLEYAKNIAYREAKKETKLGKLFMQLDFGEYAINNKFLIDNNNFIQKKTPTSKFYCIIIVNNKKYGVWRDYVNYKIFISNKLNNNCNIVFALDKSSHNESSILKPRTSIIFKSLVDHYRLGCLYFENQNIKNNCIEVLLTYFR